MFCCERAKKKKRGRRQSTEDFASFGAPRTTSSSSSSSYTSFFVHPPLLNAIESNRVQSRPRPAASPRRRLGTRANPIHPHRPRRPSPRPRDRSIDRSRPTRPRPNARDNIPSARTIHRRRPGASHHPGRSSSSSSSVRARARSIPARGHRRVVNFSRRDRRRTDVRTTTHKNAPRSRAIHRRIDPRARRRRASRFARSSSRQP